MVIESGFEIYAVSTPVYGTSGNRVILCFRRTDDIVTVVVVVVVVIVVVVVHGLDGNDDITENVIVSIIVKMVAIPKLVSEEWNKRG